MEENILTTNDNRIFVTVFGEFQIASSYGILNNDGISSEKISRLLSYILVHHQRNITIQELTDILWTDDETDNPAGALKNLVYRTRTLLKKKLGPFEFIQTSRGAYNWNTSVELCIDSESFDNYYNTSKNTKNRKQKISSLENCIRLYKGKFLNNLSSDYWVVSLSTYYQSTYLASIKQLAELYIEDLSFDKVVDICKIGLNHDNLDETLHYLLIKALMGQNKQSLALDHYNSATQQLQQALGVNTPTLLKSLHKELLAMTNTEETKLEDMQQVLDEDEPRGAFCCAYGIFCEIYRLEARRIYRLGISEYIVLFTLQSGKNKLPSEETQFHLMKKATQRFEEIIQTSLRIGDVLSRYSEFQIAVLLPTCTYESALMVSERLLEKFYKEHKHNRVTVNYTMEEVTMADPFTMN